MKRAFFAGALLLAACGQSAPQQGVPARVETGASSAADDAAVLSCATFGEDTSEASLKALYGAGNVTSAIVPGPEGTENSATILFASDPLRRVEILWRDEARRTGPLDVSIKGDVSEWVGPQGVRLGDPLARVEEKNGKPFELTGFEWDYGGTVVNWQEGALAGPPGCVQRVRFSARASSRAAAGDSIFRSDNPGVRAADPAVSEISVGYAIED